MRALVEELYAALGRGDADTLRRVCHPDFVGTMSDGMPGGLGGVHRGPDAMINDFWWPLGRAYRVRPEPEEWIGCQDGRLLVCGRYRGTAREDGREVDARFTHLWASDGEQLTAVTQVTDTARW